MSKYPITTTLNTIRARDPYDTGWINLLEGLGKTCPDDSHLMLTDILNVMGFNYAMWCLWALPEAYQRDMRQLGMAYARQVQPMMKDPRSGQALEVGERYINGKATEDELIQATDAAHEARSACCGKAFFAADAALSAMFAADVTGLSPAGHAHAVATYASEAVFSKEYDNIRNEQEALFVAMCQGTAPWQS